MSKVLIADDEIAMREMLALACRLDGHEVSQAVDAPSAIAAYAAFQPDLVLLDLSMPGGGGVEVMKRLRQAHGEQVCPVIVVTGYLDSVPGHIRGELGAFALIEKPFTMDTLRTAMRSALQPPESRKPDPRR
jgi:DNA-binding response OmpR family regulator